MHPDIDLRQLRRSLPGGPRRPVGQPRRVLHLLPVRLLRMRPFRKNVICFRSNRPPGQVPGPLGKLS